MDGAEYTVIGVHEKAKGGFFGENGEDNQVAIPINDGAEPRYPQIDRFMVGVEGQAGAAQRGVR